LGVSALSTSVLPSGRQLELQTGHYRAVVVEVGAGLRSLEHRGHPILDGYGAEDICVGARGQLLLPWPNRVRDGRYEFQGEARQLDISEPERACAIHGLVRWSAWQVLEHRSERLVLTHRLHPHPGYPHVLELRVHYYLDPDTGIEIELTATNQGANPAPYGLGMHPYLTVATPSIDTCELLIAADTWLPTDDRGIPTGTRAPVAGSTFDFRESRQIGHTAIDFAFHDLHRDAHERASVTLRDPASGRASSLWVDSAFPWIELFTGDHLPSRRRQGLGVEPMTCPPNAFASGRDLIVLEPGASHTARWGVHAKT
jgi:aldose 1-epimerase